MARHRREAEQTRDEPRRSSQPGKGVAAGTSGRRTVSPALVDAAIDATRAHLDAARASLPVLEAAVDPRGARDLETAREAADAVQRALAQARSRLDCARGDAAEAAPDRLAAVVELEEQVRALEERARRAMAVLPASQRDPHDEDAAALFQDEGAMARLDDASTREQSEWQLALGGVAGATAPLPHGDAIQDAFGHHDVSGVRAQVGGDAATAAEALDAQAYATGDRAAFASAPDLHTAAHEAAHAVQQRAGATTAGVGAEGDAYEQQADEAADAVVAGGSAESILDRGAASGGGGGGGAIQRKKPGAPGGDIAPPPPVTTEPEIRRWLNQPIGKKNIPALRKRMLALLELFAAIPTTERAILRKRLDDRGDELGRLFHGELSHALIKKLFVALDGAVVPATSSFDSVEMEAFATSVNADRFLLIPSEVILDDAYRPEQPLVLSCMPGFAPPDGEAGPVLEWRFVDRMEEVRQQGRVEWLALAVAAPAIGITVDQVGRWEMRVELVAQGRVLAKLEKSVIARSSKEDGSDLSTVIEGIDDGALMKDAESMSNAELQHQIVLVHQQLGNFHVGGRGGDEEKPYQRLRNLERELEFEASQRSINGSQVGLDPASPAGEWEMLNTAFGEPDMTTGDTFLPYAGEDDQPTQTQVQERMDALIATHGLAGARARIGELEQDLYFNELQSGGEDWRDVHTWVWAEWESRRDEADSFFGPLDEEGEPTSGGPSRFEMIARSVAEQMLVKSREKVQGELDRYQLRNADDNPGGRGDNGFRAGADQTELKNAIEEARLIRAAYDAYIALTKEGKSAEAQEKWTEFEDRKTLAIAKHPTLRPFIEGNSQMNNWMPTGTVPGVVGMGPEISALGPEHFAEYMGWELNHKLADIGRTEENINNGKLSVFGSPNACEVARLQMRIAPGSMLDGVLNERMAWAKSANGDDNWLLSLLTLGLGLLLAIPSGGTSMVITVAGEVTLLMADLYMLGKDMEQQGVYDAAKNTDMTVAESLIQEEPSAGPVIFRIFTVAAPVLGAAGVARATRELAAVREAKEAIEAIRDLRAVSKAAAGVKTTPEMTEAIERTSAIARRAGMTEEEIEQLIKVVAREGQLGARMTSIRGLLDKTDEITEAIAPELARQVGAKRIRVVNDGTATVGVRPTLERGKVVIEEIVVGNKATVADVLAHQNVADNLTRYNGMVGRVRQSLDELAEAVTGAGKMNPHTPFTGAHEAFEEVRKYEGYIRTRMQDLVAKLADGSPDAVASAARIEDDLVLMEGELAHFQSVLDDVRRTGDPGLAKGVIEAKDVGKVTDEAVAAGYPAIDRDNYFYRRWPGGGPDGAEFQVARKASAADDLPVVQPRKVGDRWELMPSEGTGRVPATYAADLHDDEVLGQVLYQSDSLNHYSNALHNTRPGLGLDPAEVERRMNGVVEKVRTKRLSPDEIADGTRRAVDEDTLRHALKQEFREDFFADAMREATPEAQLKRFRETTSELNPSDSGNMMEDFLARREPTSTQHVHVDEGKFGKNALGQSQPLKDRKIDRVLDDGTAVEVKSGAESLSERELEQLEDYHLYPGQTIDVNGVPTKVKRTMYEFTNPKGVKANLELIGDQMLDRGIHVKVYNASGKTKTLTQRSDLRNLEEWLLQ